MTWEEIAVIAEIVGAIAVVVTLIYVAKEIRQNSRSLQVTALRDTTAQWNEWSAMIATSGDLADIVAKGNGDFQSLTDSEQLRYGAYVQSFFDNVESWRSLVVDHNVNKDLAVIESITRRRLAERGFGQWWEANFADYDEEFVSWINRQRSD